MMANTIITAKPKAARGMSIVLIFNTPGTTKPIPANTSEMPMNLISASGYSIAIGIVAASSCKGVVALGSPAMMNIAARITWDIHKAMVQPFEFDFTLSIFIVFSLIACYFFWCKFTG